MTDFVATFRGQMPPQALAILLPLMKNELLSSDIYGTCDCSEVVA